MAHLGIREEDKNLCHGGFCSWRHAVLPRWLSLSRSQRSCSMPHSTELLLRAYRRLVSSPHSGSVPPPWRVKPKTRGWTELPPYSMATKLGTQTLVACR